MGEKGGSCSRILQGFYKLTSNIHRRTLYGIDEDSKRLGVQCDFSHDLAHAQAEQSMCGDGRDITLRSVFVKDDKAIKQHDFTSYHLPKSQHNFLTEFNQRRTNIVGDLRMLSNMVEL